MVALKASRMNNMNSEMNDKELDIALERVAEDDNNDNNDDFERTPSFRSPDKSFEGGLSLVRVATKKLFAFSRKKLNFLHTLTVVKHKLLNARKKLGFWRIVLGKLNNLPKLENVALKMQSLCGKIFGKKRNIHIYLIFMTISPNSEVNICHHIFVCNLVFGRGGDRRDQQSSLYANRIQKGGRRMVQC
jgi:hypothetical protein